MGNNRRIEIKHHIREEELDEMLREAEDDARLRRIGFVKNLYQGDTVPAAAEREGRSPATGSRWADAWNEGGLAALMPSFGGGRPPKLDEDERAELLERLREDHPWKLAEIQRLLDEEFDVTYHPDYLRRFLRDIGLSFEGSQSVRPSQGEESNSGPDDRVESTTSEGGESPSNGMKDDEGGWIVDRGDEGDDAAAPDVRDRSDP